jgi:hypothetical protein
MKLTEINKENRSLANTRLGLWINIASLSIVAASAAFGYYFWLV